MSLSEIEYKVYEGFPDDVVLGWIFDINSKVFPFGETKENLKTALKSRSKIVTCIALVNGNPVGFKLGFEERTYYFESWRGGVLEEYRCKGIAKELGKLQHDLCERLGFRIVTTIANNQNIPMLIVNLRNGFEIVGTFLDRKKHVKILFQKILVPIQE
jgi:RimJ/RimL family protein N-acetyltransferase